MSVSPLIRHTDRTLLLRPAYCGSIDYYALMASYSKVVVDYDARFNKRLKDTHRFSILGTGGLHELTVPLENVAGMSQMPWSAIRLSQHGEWWRLHWAAIYSAYGRTPFFEYYEDEFKPIFSPSNFSIQSLNEALNRVICDILGIERPTTTSRNISGDVDDMCTIPKIELPSVEYYQIWSSRHGFIPHLSILDLIFNMGPEAPLVLKKILDLHYKF